MDETRERYMRALWGAIAGPDFTDIPVPGSLVLYDPAVHVGQSDFQDDIKQIDYPQLLCRVNAVRLLVRQEPDFRILARYFLSPAVIDEKQVLTGTNNTISVEHGEVYSKALSFADCHNWTFYVPAEMGIALFSNPPPANGEVKFFFMTEKSLTSLTLIDFGQQGRRFTGGWSNFRLGKDFQPGDELVFLRAYEQLFVGIRRLAPHHVPRRMIEVARLRYERGEDFEVDFYPSPQCCWIVTPYNPV